ncbi:MAG TPA: DUF1236 domain-containing protein [Xanthobacteraceae bacterium]|jgi:hypothetical protein
MLVMRSATLGFALALGAVGAQAQGVVTQRIDNEPVMTTVTQGPTGTVITRQPLGAAPAPVVTTAATTSVDETIGAAPAERTSRTTRRITRRVVHHEHHVRRATSERTVTHSVRTTRRAVAARPLVLAPAQRRVIYRTLVRQQVVPASVVAPPPSVPGYPPFPPPAVPTVVVAPAQATTGYAVPEPTGVVDEDADDAPAAPVAAARVYPIGAVLPEGVAVAPLPVRAAAAVPAARPYEYAVVGGRVLLVDPASNTVVADITTP